MNHSHIRLFTDGELAVETLNTRIFLRSCTDRVRPQVARYLQLLQAEFSRRHPVSTL